MKAWHFISADRKLKYEDNRPVVDGRTLKYKGVLPIKLCERGMHFSLNVLDALKYAPGLIACYVEVEDTALLGDDKGVAYTRKVIKSIDATEIVIKFAILQAQQGYNNPKWNEWAKKWLDGTDRTANAANAAYAANAVARYAANAAYAAAYAANAANAAYAANAAAYAANAANAAAYAANAAAYAAASQQTQNKLLETMLFEAMGIEP